jgi:uncharacterized protein YegP (UPF0339 family)
VNGPNRKTTTTTETKIWWTASGPSAPTVEDLRTFLAACGDVPAGTRVHIHVDAPVGRIGFEARFELSYRQSEQEQPRAVGDAVGDRYRLTGRLCSVCGKQFPNADEVPAHGEDGVACSGSPPKSRAGVFEIYQDRAGKYRFRLEMANGQACATGEAYETKAACRRGCTAVQLAAAGAQIVEVES